MKLGNERNRANLKKHLTKDNLGDLWDFLDNMNTGEIYDSMVFRKEDKIKSDYKMVLKDDKSKD